jgi:ELWxxDGT repeat protein
MGPRPLFSTFLMLFVSPLVSAQPYLVKDITANPSPVSSSPVFLGVAGGVTFIAPAPAGNNDLRALWKSDGTAEGTVEVSSTVHPIPPPSEAEPTATLGNRLFFIGDDGRGRQLFVSDGTAAGTVRLTSASSGYRIIHLFSSGTFVYFSGVDETSGSEPWISDGTPSGTRLLTDLETGLPSSDPIFLGQIGSSVIFSAYQNGQRRLFRTNGTKAGTVAFAICSLGAGATVGNRVAFSAVTDDYQSWNLMTTDGTAAGTSTLKTFKGFPAPKLGVGNGDRLFFVARDESGLDLWVTDGTLAGTVPLKTGGGTVAFAGNLIYLFTPSSSSSNQSDLSTTDGTVGGARLVKAGVTLAPYTLASAAGFLYFCDSGSLYKTDGTSVTKIEHLTTGGAGLTDLIGPAGDSLLFSFGDATYGTELWSTDGTAATAHLLANIAPDKTARTLFYAMQTLGNQVIFVGQSGDQARIWTSDGTSDGTQSITDLPSFSADSWRSVVVNGTYFLTAGNALWRSNGTAAGTYKLATTQGDGNLSKFRNGVIFVGCVNSACGMWTSDGTTAGTHRIGNGAASVTPDGGEIGNNFWFVGTGSNAWRTDGTSIMVVGGSGKVTNPSFTEFDGFVYFMAGNDLLKSDGTSPTTVGTIPTIDARIVRVGSKLLILSRGNLWRSDGTTVTRVTGGFFEPCGTSESFVVDGEVLYFISYDNPGNSDGLWRSDGTAAGTYLIASFSAVDCRMLPFGHWSYLMAGDAHKVGDVWATDRTSGQTFRVTSVNGSGSINNQFAIAGSTLFFNADDLVHGIELWALPLIDSHRRPVR